MTSQQRVTAGYVAPFIAFLALLAIDHALNPPTRFFYPLRFVIVSGLLLTLSRPYLALRPALPLASILAGAAVFAIWVAPDLLFGYRHFWLFENSLTGKTAISISGEAQRSLPFLILRVTTSVVLVPLLEELFWRGWMMRWLIDPAFTRVRFGAYKPLAFWLVAVFFASEHGPYWEVGLAAGVVYNWWAVRTKSLADCILAHAVTNGILSAYVLLTGQWQYWL